MTDKLLLHLDKCRIRTTTYEIKIMYTVQIFQGKFFNIRNIKSKEKIKYREKKQTDQLIT